MGRRRYRVILDGEDAVLAHEDAQARPILEDAEANPLFETVSAGAVADFTGGGPDFAESYNDNYEMPMGYRERTSQRHADGRPTFGTPPFGPPIDEDDPGDDPRKWSEIRKSSSTMVYSKSDGKSVSVLEISDVGDGALARSSAYPINDLDGFSPAIAAIIGKDEATWREAPAHDRAYAMLMYDGGQHETEYGSVEEAIKSEIG
jgi:hypothetical protein